MFGLINYEKEESNSPINNYIILLDVRQVNTESKYVCQSMSTIKHFFKITSIQARKILIVNSLQLGWRVYTVKHCFLMLPWWPVFTDEN